MAPGRASTSPSRNSTRSRSPRRSWTRGSGAWTSGWCWSRTTCARRNCPGSPPGRALRSPAFGKLHHKLMVVDDSVVIAGSFNYTAPANQFNDENIFVLGSPYPDLPRREGGPADLDRCAELAAFFRAEIDRIEAAGERFIGRR
ncbi:phospholipase D-like domain-containing protein [Plantactinospora sp. WMMB334]|uniref:phospholipase D-like domain-containing protein n=1 Tax=Plantactinospora sp. WMMB334 TaxID=3404119 RepID=UPI003B92FCC9